MSLLPVMIRVRLRLTNSSEFFQFSFLSILKNNLTASKLLIIETDFLDVTLACGDGKQTNSYQPTSSTILPLCTVDGLILDEEVEPENEEFKPSDEQSEINVITEQHYLDVCSC